MAHQSAKAIVSKLRLIVLTLLLVSMNACMIADYQITAQGAVEKGTIAALRDGEPVYVVIPRYSRTEIHCDSGGGGRNDLLIGLALLLLSSSSSSCREYRDAIGVQMHDGVSMAIQDVRIGKLVEIVEHIPSQGMVCVVTVNEESSDYSELFSAVRSFNIPAYATHTYVLSYAVLLDFNTLKEYEYHVTEKAISGLVSWLLFPVMYPIWDGIKMEMLGLPARAWGPPASVVSEITKTFLSEAHRDGIL